MRQNFAFWLVKFLVPVIVDDPKDILHFAVPNQSRTYFGQIVSTQPPRVMQFALKCLPDEVLS